MHTSARASIVLTLLLAGTLWCSPACRAQEEPDLFTGTQYTIFLYGGVIDIFEATLSFEENFKLLIDPLDGVGVYVPAGPVFGAFFSSPNYNSSGETLSLIVFGTVVGDFIVGAWVAALDVTLQGAELFAGYLK